MKVLANRLCASSIAVKKELFDFLNKEANYISQIPQRYTNFQTKPHPYFIIEGEPLKRLMEERKEKQMQLKQPNKEIIAECDGILKLLKLFKAYLVFVSLTA
jgi:hypothetical protein